MNDRHNAPPRPNMQVRIGYPNCRSGTHPPRPNMQAGFITVLVMPLWDLLACRVFTEVRAGGCEPGVRCGGG